MSTEVKYADGVVTPEFDSWLRYRDDFHKQFYELDLPLDKWVAACNEVSGETYGIMSVRSETVRNTVSFEKRLRVGTVITALRRLGHTKFADLMAKSLDDPSDIRLREYFDTHRFLQIKLQTLLSGCWEQLFTQFATISPARFNGEAILRIKAYHNNELTRCDSFLKFISENYRIADTLQDLFTCLVAAGQISVLENFGVYAAGMLSSPIITPPRLACLRCGVGAVGAVRCPCYHAAECIECLVNLRCVKCDSETSSLVRITIN